MNPTIATIVQTNGRAFREAVADSAREWFAFRRRGDAAGKMLIECSSMWAGYSEEKPYRELRTARPVDPEKWRFLAAKVYESPLIVTDTKSLLAWLLLGGEALVERSVAEV